MDYSDASAGAGSGSEPPCVESVADLTQVAADDVSVVPAALTAMVGSAREALRAVQTSAAYPPQVAVEAVETTTAVLARLSTHFEPYVGDYSRAGGTSMGRARESLRQGRMALSDARHQLALDSPLAEEVALVGLVASPV